MTFVQFMTLLDFTPKGVIIYSNGCLIGDYKPNEYVWEVPFIKSLKVVVLSINRADEIVELEAAE